MSTLRIHGYVVFSGTNLESQYVWTNANDALKEFKKFPTQMALYLKPKNKLPSGYKKVIDLPPNNVTVEIDQTHPNRAGVIFVPIALAVDIVLLPVELPVMYAFATRGPG